MRPIVPFNSGDFLSGQVIRAARSVLQCSDSGASQVYYRDALSNELRQQKLDVQICFPVDVWQNRELADLYFLDLLVEWQAVVQIEASDRPITDEDRDQMVEYLETSRSPVGLLLRFGRDGLAFERIASTRRSPARNRLL